MCKLSVLVFLFFKQKTAYEMRISDWSSDVCSADLQKRTRRGQLEVQAWCRVSSRRFLGWHRTVRHSSMPALTRRGTCSGAGQTGAAMRSAERRDGKEVVSTGRLRWSPDH